MNKSVPVWIILLILSTNIFAQSQPELFSKVDSLVKYITGSNFEQNSSFREDLDLIDSLYYHSRKIADDRGEALLMLSMAALPFQKFPIKAPLSGMEFGIPLPQGPNSLFERKIKNLPSHFLFDSRGNFGDKDKLSHFFGNAYLTYTTGCFTITKFMGILVELFEFNFKKNGEVNRRDMMLNYLGGLFGLALKKNNAATPSEFIKLYSLFYLRIYI
ncbi:MAG: hypothetical protein D6830_01935 [Ignavibacteria bacterium]|nr:MAG: hypothetical protein D6830_01935 [Ignavibacteria bacterium]